MDPISQGAAGATFSQVFGSGSKKKLGLIGLLGFLSGLAPDLDILIRSPSDPLLALEYHRQFTHSLFFIPIGGWVCALVLYQLISRRHHLSFKSTWLACTLGYGTHGLIDACTSYGTVLFWPFSNERIAWNNISIIDPVFTIPIFALVVTTAITKNQRYAKSALIWGLSYLSLGLYCNHLAISAGKQLAKTRGHKIVKIMATPSIANLILWRIIYETNDRFYIDAVNIVAKQGLYTGSSLNKLNVAQSFPWLNKSSQQAKDIERCAWFSNQYLAINPLNNNQIMDIRYSWLPNKTTGLWGIELNPNKQDHEHVRFIRRHTESSISTRSTSLKKMLLNQR